MLGKYKFVWISLNLVTASILVETGQCNVEGIEPGQCLSKFDYDHKIMQKMLQLEVKISEQAREVEELKRQNRCADAKQVAFMAQLSKNIVNTPADTIIVFDTVHTNVGGGYKSGPGMFVAPGDGSYSINLVASSYTKLVSEHLHLYIMHNTSKVGYIFLDSNRDRSLLRSTTAVLELSAGDTVFVRVGNSNPKGTILGCCFHTVLSGFLIK